MALIFLVASLLVIATPTLQVPMNDFEGAFVHPAVPKTSNFQKAAESQEINGNLQAFIEDKLVQHSQALEQLLRMSEAHGDHLRQLVENISKEMTPTKPKLPEKIEVQPSRRSGGITSTDRPLTWGDKLPLYGNLIRNFFVNEYRNDSEPVVVIEESYIPGEKLHRKNNAQSNPEPVPRLKSGPHTPWCKVSLLCKPTYQPVCGFDERFGYGKFDDFCHMMRVNCFWNYEFSLSSNCKSTV